MIIGGGIIGAGVARDAALRGLDVALFEKDDFAQGTSSRSTKLVHGGLRYLENYDFRLVREALRERETLLDIASHLVYKSKFFFPVYEETRVSALTLRAGLTFYDLLAWGRGIGKHEFIGPEEAVESFPGLRTTGLKTIGTYFDCQMDDSRLVLSNVLDARRQGAKVANYARVEEVDRAPSGSAWKVEIYDKLHDDKFAVEAKKIINATGPWSDDVADDWRSGGARFLRPTKGAHLVLPPLGAEVAGFFPSIHDDRLFFVIPWEDRTLVGTTDTDFSGSPDELTVNQQDRNYLLTNINNYLDRVEFTESDILTEFAGLRPLYSSSRGEVDEFKVSRDHEILIEEGSIYTIIGGKYTTYRAMAEEALDLMETGTNSSTDVKKLPGAWEKDGQRKKLKSILLSGYSLSEFQAEVLLNRYGSKAGEVMEKASRYPDFEEPVGGGEVPIKAQVYYSVTNEMSFRPEDVMRRRTGLFLRSDPDKEEIKGIINSLDPGELEVQRGD